MSVLVGKKAPSFSSKAIIDGEKIVENFSLEQFIGKKTVVLFFYPKDFTFVCPTELFAFQEKLKSFNAYTPFTLSRAIQYLSGDAETPRQYLMAGSVVVTLPVLFIFVYFEKYLVSGLTAGSVKG